MISIAQRTLGRLLGREFSRGCRSPSPASVRFILADDVEAINLLYNDRAARPDAAGVRPRTAEQWRWEFIQPAASTAPPYVAAWHEGRIVGTQGYIPIQFVCDGRLVPTGKDEDTLVHPAHRGRGLLDAMYQPLSARAKTDGVELLWGFTSTAIEPLKRNGFVEIGRHDGMIATAWRIPEAPPAGLRIENWSQASPDCDQFSLEVSRCLGGIMPHLSAAYLNWRVTENPFRRYRMTAAHAGENLVGLAVFKLDDQRETGFISEWVGLSTERHSVADVLSAVLRPGLLAFQQEGYGRVEARPSGEHPFNRQARTLLGRLGFVRTPKGRSTAFLVRPITADARQFLRMKRWRISEIMREY